jgi:hypothetical protein
MVVVIPLLILCFAVVDMVHVEVSALCAFIIVPFDSFVLCYDMARIANNMADPKQKSKFCWN